MSENKSDFIRDPQKIKEEMDKIVEYLRVKKGFNIGSNVFSVGKDANGYVMELRTVVDNIYDLPSGWNYGTYYLDGYPKTGMYTMKDGKYMFLPTKNEIDKSKVIEYKTVQDFKDAIIAANPHLENQVSITSGFGAEGIIQIEGSRYGIDLPTTDLYYDESKGCIVSSINPGIEFRVEFVRSAEVNNETNVRDASVDSSVNTSLDSAAIKNQESIDTRGESEGKGVSIADYGFEIFDFNQMKYVADKYKFGNDNNVISKEEDGARYKIEGGRSVDIDSDPRRVEAILKLNKIWVQSYNMALAGAGKEPGEDSSIAFSGEVTANTFNTIIIGLKNGGSNLKMSELPQLLFDKFGFEQAGFIKVMMYFISNPTISSMFQLEMDVSPDMAIQMIDKIKFDALKEEATDVMEKIFQPNQNPNGTNN